MPKLLTGKMLPPQLRVFLPVLRRNRSEVLPRVKKTLQAGKRQLFWEPLTRIRHLPVSVQESQLLSSSWNMYWHGTKLRETNTLFWVSFRKHYVAYLLLLVNHILIWESCFMGSLSSVTIKTRGPWVSLLRAVITEPQWALLNREKQCSHTGERVCCSLMLCCTLTLFANWNVGQAAQGSGGITKNVWMWHLGTWFSAEHAGFSLVVGLYDLRFFPALSILWFYDPSIPLGKQ